MAHCVCHCVAFGRGSDCVAWQSVRNQVGDGRMNSPAVNEYVHTWFQLSFKTAWLSGGHKHSW